jgi:circadian clock protein KaiC
MQKLPQKNTFSLTEKLKSGIDGLDNILDGGFLKSTTIMVEGASGTGKTVMGIHYLQEGIKNDEKCLLLATEESSDFIIKYINSFNIISESVAENPNICIVDRIFSSTSIEEVIDDVIARVKANSVQRVVIDFVNTFVEFSDNFLTLKTILRNLINFLNFMGCTTILILNEEQTGANYPLKSLIQPLVQGEIYLSSSVRKGKRYRSLEVNKMKGQKYISGKHLAEISSQGMSVFQRLGGM